MLHGFAGSLVSEYFAEALLGGVLGRELDAHGAAAARLGLLQHRRTVSPRLGPVCGARQVFDLAAAPLLAALGHAPSAIRPNARGTLLLASGTAAGRDLLFVTTAWGEQLGSCTREALRAALGESVRWCLCVNGVSVRLLDAHHAHARRYVEFDLDLALHDPVLFGVLWALLRADAFGGLERVVEASDRNTVGVCRSLREGVLEALGQLLNGFLRARRSPAPLPLHRLAAVHEQALTVVYRILFLLFAESRRLVPTWHPVYRDSYSVESLLALAERPGPAAGIWEGLQAISRLAHSGCHAGSLEATPFNGRLFSPAATPLADSVAVDEETARRAVLSLGTTRMQGGRARIVYRDLDVEQLGAVYESVLDYTPHARRPGKLSDRPAVDLVAGSGVRKATATFYTPRALTTYLVRRTLAPLVADASPEQILSLRVLDPAMGSGAFLVAACRFLAAEYAAALVRCGRCLPADLDEGDRRGFRRVVAQRCLYGVDLNPMAVQLARLSLWLATLSPDRPLTFLDHRLLVGNSLVGASLDEVMARPGAWADRAPRRLLDGEVLPLFGAAELGPDLRAALPGRRTLAEVPDDTLEQVREKERLAAALSGPNSPLARWKAVLDLWCGQAFVREFRGAPRGLFAAIADHVLTGRSPLSAPAATRWLERLRAPLPWVRPFHWPLEFPEVFYGADGTPLPDAGFDAVLGNPPWDMVRADNPDTDASRSRDEAAGLLRFARASGIYRALGEGHVNRYQLFVERALRLVRRGGRVGLVVPWGLLSDHGCAPLRRLLFDRTTLDPVVGFDNADRIFPIHRSVRFVAVSASLGGSTPRISTRLGQRDASALDRLPSDGTAASDFPVAFSRSLLESLSGPGLAVPDVRSGSDALLLEKLARSAPPLSPPAAPRHRPSLAAGWNAVFGRELNATDDRAHFVTGGEGLPVLDGKHIEPFRVLRGDVTRRIPEPAARQLLEGRVFGRPRLAYRDVSSATNRLTLIAAIVPGGCVTVHTLFCLRTALPLRAQRFLCAVLNSLVANYFVRFWVSSHVTTAIIGRLPVPRPDPSSGQFRRLAALSAALSRSAAPLSHPAYPLLQAEVARLYALTTSEFERILATFPLIQDTIRQDALAAFLPTALR